MLFTSERSGVIPLSENFISELLPEAPGDYVKVYIYAAFCVARGEDITLDEFCARLGLSRDFVVRAFEYWQDQGAVRIKNGSAVSFELLEIKKTDVSALYGNAQFTQAVRKLFYPRELSVSELSRIMDYTPVFRLPEEVALMLCEYCIDRKGRDISVAYMDKVAKGWAEEGLTSVEAVQRRMSEETRKKHPANLVLKKLGIGMRQPTDAEMKLYDKWTGRFLMEPEAIIAVCEEKTPQNPSFKYLDAVLCGAHEAGARTREEMLAYMARAAEQKPARPKKTVKADFTQREYIPDEAEGSNVIIIGEDDD